jgi:hypothetical protein
MDILARAFRLLADERPAAAYAALASTLEKGIADRDIDADDTTIVGEGLAKYANRLTITDGEGRRLPPTAIRVHHNDYYSDPVIVSDHEGGATMISIPDTEEPFGVIAWPLTEGHRHEVVAIG